MEPLPGHDGPRAVGDENPSFVAETRFSGAIVPCLWPRDEVARVLPAALHLATPPDGVRDRHPVVFIFGEHDRSKVFYASLALPTGVRFLEFLIAVPFVHAAPDTGPSVFLPRVFSGEPVVTWSGNAHYGFAKRMVPMEWLGETFVVSDEQGSLLTHVSSEPRAPWRRVTGAPLQALANVVALGHLPVFGHRADGSLVRSQFDWDFGDAWIRSVRAIVSVDASLGRGLAPRQSHGSPAACLEVSGMRWRLSWPETQRRGHRGRSSMSPRATIPDE
jgi:hypothetical protein